MKKLYLFLGLIVFLVGCQTTGNASKELLLGEFSLEDVEKHSSVEDCWVVLHDQVYDITDFIAAGKHGPLNNWCGEDISEAFENRPKSGTPHSENARDIAENLLIGNLKK